MLVFTDGSFENRIGEWGFFIHDCSTAGRVVAGGCVPQPLIEFWLATVGDQVITQVELYAVLMARMYLSSNCLDRQVIYYIDNDPARDSLIRGFSESDASLTIILQFYLLERHWPSAIWFARVPSHSNLADRPSRGEVEQVAKEFGAAVVSVELGMDVQELLCTPLVT